MCLCQSSSCKHQTRAGLAAQSASHAKTEPACLPHAAVAASHGTCTGTEGQAVERQAQACLAQPLTAAPRKTTCSKHICRAAPADATHPPVPIRVPSVTCSGEEQGKGRGGGMRRSQRRHCAASACAASADARQGSRTSTPAARWLLLGQAAQLAGIGLGSGGLLCGARTYRCVRPGINNQMHTSPLS